MKVLSLVLALLMLSSVMVFADQTGTSWFHSHSYTDNDSYVDRYSEYQTKKGLPVEAQAEVILLRADIFNVPTALSTMGSYDITNNDWRISTKVSVDISNNPVSNAIKSSVGIK